MRGPVLAWVLAFLCSSTALGQPKAPAKKGPAGPTPPATRQPSAPPAKNSAPAKSSSSAPASVASADDQAIRRVVDAVAKAYNAHDPKQLAALFTSDGEIVDEDGNIAHGRGEIERIFADVFQEHPLAVMQIEVESIRPLGPGVAVEEGITKVTHEPGQPAERCRYSVVHVKQDGRWQMAACRDVPDAEARAESELEQLGWLIGNWVDEGADGLVKTSYRWNDSHTFILGEFSVHIAGRPAMVGAQRLGWDPVARKIRSWVFDSRGGFAEAYWTLEGDQWVARLNGVTRDGQMGSATNYYTRLGPDRYAFEGRDRVIGGQPQQDNERIVVVREPPKPRQ